MSKFLGFKKNWSEVVLFLVIFVGLSLRLLGAVRGNCDYLDDCGRDLLVAKRVAEGKTSLWISPITALEALSSSPQYYVILGGLYKLGGLAAISFFNVFMGLGVILISYLIVLQLTRDKALGLCAALIVCFLPLFIRASITTWQPYWQYVFGGVALWLSLKAWEEKTVFWHLGAAFSLMPLIHQEYFALPFAMILTGFLILSWYHMLKLKKNKNLVQFLLLFIVLSLVWGSFFGVVYGMKGKLVGKNFLQEIHNNQVFTFESMLKRAESLPRVVLYGLTDPRKYDQFWGWLLYLTCVATLFILYEIPTQSKKIQWGLVSVLFLSTFVVLIDPGVEPQFWHFSLQVYIFILVLVMLPHFLQFNRLWLYVFEISLLLILVGHNQFSFRELLAQKAYAMTDSAQLAQLIHADARAQNLGFTQFRLVVSRYYTPGWMRHDSRSEFTNLDLLASTYDTAGVQLSLELLDPQYEARTTVVPASQFWSNYIQAPSEVYYVICQQYFPNSKELCVKDLHLPDATLESKTFLGSVSLSQNDLGYVYRLNFTHPATSSQSAEFSLQ